MVTAVVVVVAVAVAVGATGSVPRWAVLSRAVLWCGAASFRGPVSTAVDARSSVCRGVGECGKVRYGKGGGQVVWWVGR